MQRPLKSDVDPAASRGMRRWFFLATAVFHALLFAYVLLRIQPALDYARSGPLFFRNRAFLRSYLEYPGGPLDLAATALAQFGFSNQAGALCFTLLAGLVFLVVLSGWRSIVNRRAAMEPFVAAFLLLLARQENHVQSLTAGLGVVLSWGMAVAYSRLPGRLGWWRSVFPVLASPAIFIVGGPWPCALFLLGVLLFETPPTRRWAVALVGLVAGISAVLAAAGKPDLAKFFNPWETKNVFPLAATAYCFIPLAALVAGLRTRTSASKAPAATREVRVSAKDFPNSRNLRSHRLRFAAMTAAVLAGGAWLWLAFDRPAQALAGIEYAASHREFSNVVARATKLDSLTPAAEIRLQFALSQNGRLLSDLFSFTNQTTWELLPGMRLGSEAARAQVDTLFELGQVNDAEHLAHEALEYEGDRPELLWRLAQINVLKDRPDAARVFLNVLRQSPAHRARAEGRLRELDADPRLTGDRELALVRSRMVNTDLPHDGMPTETFMDQLLHTNPRNPMALEYFLAHQLLTLDLEHFAAKVGQLSDFGCKTLPRHCEEAVLLYQRLRGKEVDLHGCQISPETRQRFQALCGFIDRGELRNADADRALARDFGDTYWSFYLTHVQAKPAENHSMMQ